MSALYLELLVRAYKIALHGQKHPPGTGTPSGAEKVTKSPSRAVWGEGEGSAGVQNRWRGVAYSAVWNPLW